MKKKIISLAIVLLVLMTLFPTAYAADNSTVTLTADDVKMRGGTITAYLGPAAPLNSIFNIVIPEAIGGRYRNENRFRCVCTVKFNRCDNSRHCNVYWQRSF